MQIKLKFLGAARNVTGSCYLMEANGTRILVDCGLYQEREFKARSWKPFPVPPESIDALLLTHAHVDHSGLIPKLVREGFKGNIYCTSATSDIAQIALLDSARLQEEDAAFKRKRHQREGRKGTYPEIPLYTTEDAEASLDLFAPVDYRETVTLADGVAATFYDAGHIFGSSMIKVRFSENGQSRNVIFSGDVGRRDKPILHDPTFFDEADYVLIESTYGDRVHDDSENIPADLARVINETRQAGGNIIVPSFAIERAQEILYHLNELLIANRIPHIMVFLDSPMAVKVTEVFKEHPEFFDEEMAQRMREGRSPFDFPGLVMVKTADESKAINHIKGTSMIIAGSGMCNGGRVKHHLVANISRPESTILFVGYQAIGTLGREIVSGAREVRILGQKYPVEARIEQIGGFSAHADRDELMEWLSGLKKAPRRIFITHGESEVVEKFADYLRDATGWDVLVPDYKDEVILT
ncbi:MAG: MBL fold metallo-hydrolase [Chloroflexota bacterium]|nr:MBL fold metallo-hydrolase [Chloroflexota bacterium]